MKKGPGGAPLLFALVIGISIGFTTPARASALLLPGGSGSSLPTRLVKVDAYVSHGLARVQVEYRFRNDSYNQIEGVLRTRIPQCAVVTDFAYYFKGARIAGRVMENAKAEEIYRAITSRWRDPALFRRKDDGRYEARIFPIESQSDLRVELEYCYALPEDKGAMKLFYPMSAGAPGGPIEKVELKARFTGDPLSNVIAGDGKARLISPTQGEVTWSAADYRPAKDLLLVAMLQRKAVDRETLVSRTSRGETFTAVRLRGNTRRIPAGYLPGPALFGSTTRFAFTRGRREGTAVSGVKLAPLWAQAQVQALYARDPGACRKTTRSEVIRLSRRYRIDTKLTSYLAVPQSEWATYKESLLQRRRELVDNYEQVVRSRQYALQLPMWGVPGDPVIRVPARPELVKAVAVLPDGDLLPLRLDPVTQCWEARFDLPEGAAEGGYRVTLYLFERDGRRSTLTLTYHVDLTPPEGRVAHQDGRLRVNASPDTERVTAFMANGATLELKVAGEPGRFELELPPGARCTRVRLYDRVHHWIELEVEVDE